MYETLLLALEDVQPLRDGAERCQACAYYRRCLDLDGAAACAIRALLAENEALRAAAQRDLHALHTCCMALGDASMDATDWPDEEMQAACGVCKGPGAGCWEADPGDPNRCAAFAWRGAREGGCAGWDG